MQDATKIMEGIKYHQSRINQVMSVIKSTLTGAVIEVKQEIKTDVDRFFSNRAGDVVKDTVDFIKNYSVPYDQYEESLKISGFSNTLYLVFQAFRQALDAFMTESVNPVIIRFVRDEEQKILERLSSAADPYHDMVRSGLSGDEGLMKTVDNHPPGHPAAKGAGMPDVDAIKGFLGLTFPPVATAMRFSARIKTDAVLRLGFHTVIGVVKKIFKKADQDPNEHKILALKEGVKRIKRETEKAIAFHFKNHKENLKFQYMFVLVDAISSMVSETLISRFEVYDTDLTHLSGLMNKQENDKESTLEILDEMSRVTKGLEGRIAQTRQKINESPFI